MKCRRYFYFTCPSCGLEKMLDIKTGEWRHDWAQHHEILARAREALAEKE